MLLKSVRKSLDQKPELSGSPTYFDEMEVGVTFWRRVSEMNLPQPVALREIVGLALMDQFRITLHVLNLNVNAPAPSISESRKGNRIVTEIIKSLHMTMTISAA